MSDDIEVTEAGVDDVAAVSALIREAWREAGPGAPGFSGATDEVIAEVSAPAAIEARIGGPERRMFLARRRGRVVGFSASRRLTSETVELAGAVVLQSMVGLGIGRPLVEAAIESARSHGFTRMTVSTEVDNERALGFYRALGFNAAGTGETDVGETDIEIQYLELLL
jgi:ribosomal protein S18 acetylase RimI-like enzyme